MYNDVNNVVRQYDDVSTENPHMYNDTNTVVKQSNYVSTLTMKS